MHFVDGKSATNNPSTSIFHVESATLQQIEP
jgi:hypothetical protein